MTLRRDQMGRFVQAAQPREQMTRRAQIHLRDEDKAQQDETVLLSQSSASGNVLMSDGEQYFSGDDDVAEHDSFLERVHSAIEYTNSQLSQHLPILQTIHFSVRLPVDNHKPPESHVTALSLLRSSQAINICTSETHEVFELGCPSPYMVAACVGHTSSTDPQWWMNKSAAEIKAGPLAGKEDVRRAQAKTNELETKRRKRNLPTKKQTDMDWKLVEGLRRQESGLEMFDADDDDHDVDDHDVDDHDVDDQDQLQTLEQEEDHSGSEYDDDAELYEEMESDFTMQDE
ncbi:hypothetical protein DE146DRAFT_769901 [Phaeosphaeria sp. MPI-PUGE-AT-0046c]|nr:hypothetical protein DE146DRAFT_769901 [Phaeosphaeria sp. MPI-PUGE-AT-0046c]